jgi:uncharacterized membrane protein YhaH (DUF805 family)
MSFAESIRTVLRKYADFTGRATRAEYWWWALFHFLVVAVLLFLDVNEVEDNGSLGTLLAGIWIIAALLPYLAVTVRRLRDAGYGWGHLFWLLVPGAGGIVLMSLLAQPTRADRVAAA